MIPDGPHYVVIIERDTEPSDDITPRGPLVWETYLGQDTTLEEAKRRAAELTQRYGRVRIAHLVFLPEGA